MKKRMVILGIVLVGIFFASFDVKANGKQELSNVDVLQNKIQVKANGIDIYSYQKTADITFNRGGNQMETISPLATPFEFENFVNEGEQRWNSRNGIEITTVVIHHMAMTDYDGVPEIWRTREASAHYGIGPNGEIRAYVGEEKRAWHAGNGNSYSIGIECCNSSMGPEWKVSEETVSSLIKLIQDINLRYGKIMTITGHKCVPGNTTECPGPSLMPRLSEIRQKVSGKYY